MDPREGLPLFSPLEIFFFLVLTEEEKNWVQNSLQWRKKDFRKGV